MTRSFLERIGLNKGDLLIILGIILISLPLLWSIRTSYLQNIEDRKWQETPAADATTPDSGLHERPPWPPTKILIDKMNLSAVVVEGWSDKDLDRGPMHLSGTANPGERGNCCIAAHKEKWFKKLRTLGPGDKIVLHTHQYDYIYEATERRTIKPSYLEILQPTQEPTITLITCTGIPYGGSKNRLIILGKLHSKTRVEKGR